MVIIMRGDLFFKTRRITDEIDIVEVISPDPNGEFLVQVVDMFTEEKSWIHPISLTTWSKVDNILTSDYLKMKIGQKPKRS